MFKNCLYRRGKPQKSPPPSVRTEKPPLHLEKKVAKRNPHGENVAIPPYGRPQGVESRRSPPLPLENFIFFCYLGGLFVTFSLCGGHFLLYGGPFLDLAPLRKLLRAPMAPPHRPSSEKMCYLICPEKGGAPILLPPPFPDTHPHPTKIDPPHFLHRTTSTYRLPIVSHKTMLI